jgi:hypothetical protein
MGTISAPAPVLALVAVTSHHDEAFAWSTHQLIAQLGPVALTSRSFAFDQTDYYATTMGSDLRKQFLAFQRLLDPAQLSHLKVATNRLETEFQALRDWPEPRALNLDPGYLSQDKLVLASTKNHAHRLYLAEGIYAEITLQYRGRRWQTCPWTYPDYQHPDYHAFFMLCRDELRRRLLTDADDLWS